MKILHVITALVYGGAEKLLVNTASAMAGDHEIHICYLKDEPRVASQFDPRIRIIKAPYGIKTIPFLRKLYKELRPDIIHTHCPHADLLGHAAVLGLRLRMVSTIHNIWIKWNAADYLIFLMYRVLFTLCRTRVVAISDVVRDHIMKRFGVKNCSVIRLHNAIPEIRVANTKNELRTQLWIDQTSFCALFIGRLEQQKSVHTLIHCAALAKQKIQNLRVLIVGHGRQKQMLVELTKSLSLEGTVFFIDPVPNPERYYVAADMFVLPSIFEGFGIVIIEAFRAGLPVLSTDIEGPKELIQNGINGLLVPPGDHKALSEAMILLAQNTELRIRIGALGRATYEGKFTITDYIRQLVEFYRKP
jgi:glycosyltransferase involved in cell wall biosynthesis